MSKTRSGSYRKLAYSEMGVLPNRAALWGKKEGQVEALNREGT